MLATEGERELNAVLDTISKTLSAAAKSTQGVEELEGLKATYSSHLGKLKEVLSGLDQKPGVVGNASLQAQRQALLHEARSKDAQLRDALEQLRALQFELNTLGTR